MTGEKTRPVMCVCQQQPETTSQLSVWRKPKMSEVQAVHEEFVRFSSFFWWSLISQPFRLLCVMSEEMWRSSFSWTSGQWRQIHVAIAGWKCLILNSGVSLLRHLDSWTGYNTRQTAVWKLRFPSSIIIILPMLKILLSSSCNMESHVARQQNKSKK